MLPRIWEVFPRIVQYDQQMDQYCQWSFQDPKMEVLYHILWPYSGGISPKKIGLIYGIGTSNLGS